MRPLIEVMESDSIVIFGASQDPYKPGALLLKVLRDTEYLGRVAGINPKGGEVHGFPLYKNLDEVPFQVELAVMLIPPPLIPQAAMECARNGVKGIVITAEGFKESGAEGNKYQIEISEILKSSGMRGFGPNTLGIVNTESGLTTSYFSTDRMLRPGHIGFAAQSGIFVGALLRYLSTFEKLHISKGIGLGNKVDVDECDAMRYFAKDSQTRTIGLYLEDIRDGRKFIQSAKSTSQQKPVLLLKGGRTALGARATASHTASLAMDDAILEGAILQTGVVRVEGIDEMIGSLMGFEWMPLPKGDCLAIVTFSGAQAIMSVDAAVKNGLSIAKFSPETSKSLAGVISTASKAQNPIDIYPDMNRHGFEKTNTEILKALFKDEGVNGILFIVMGGPEMTQFNPLLDVIRSNRSKPFFICMMATRDDEKQAFDFMMRNRVPCFKFPELAVKTFANMWQYAKWHRSDK